MEKKKTDIIPRFGVPGNRREDVDGRRKWVEEKTGARFEHVGHFSIDTEKTTHNVENMIGVCQMPIGVAGPLLIEGDHAKGEFFVPMATTEGALVRSYERGMIAITKSGGAKVKVLADHTHISPLFQLDSLAESAAFAAWVSENIGAIRAEAESTTRHGKLLGVRPFLFGRSVVLQFDYSTGDAMGLNMITIATDKACRYIVKERKVRRWIIESNLSSEKKVSAFNLIQGKGKEVVAEATLSQDIVRRNLHTTPRDMVDVVAMMRMGAAKAGMPAPNAHLANGITALFMACGQDVASVVNCSAGFTQMEVDANGDLYLWVSLPSLILGTVGGGTGLGSHRECLEMIGCSGAGKAKKLAEITAAMALAGEISITAAIVSSEFAQAHDQLGRNRPS